MILRALLAAAVLATAAPAFAQTDPAPDRPQPSPEMRAAMQAVRKACEADIRSLCADAATSGDRRAVGQCLRQNADKLSPDCKDALAKRRAQMQSQRPQ